MFGLEMLGEVLTAGNLRHGKYGRNLGVWAWGLLGRCRDVGQLGSEDVGILRELGKQASWLGRRVVVGEVREEVQEKEMEEMEEEEEEDEGGEADQREMDQREVYKVQEEVPQNRIEDYEVVGSKEATQTEQVQGGAEQTHDIGTGIISRNSGSETKSSDSPLIIDSVRASEADVDLEAVGAAQERLLSSLDTIEDTQNDPEAARLQLDYQIIATHPDIAASLNETSQECMPTMPDETSREDMLATLDMVITIVGESYGQRDLLDTRLLWDELNP